MKIVYIACPYSVGDTMENVKISMSFTHMFITLGLAPFNPLLYHFQNQYREEDYEKWMEIDFEFVKRCDCLFRVPGESKGADREVELAKQLGKPFFYSVTELHDWKYTAPCYT